MRTQVSKLSEIAACHTMGLTNADLNSSSVRSGRSENSWGELKYFDLQTNRNGEGDHVFFTRPKEQKVNEAFVH